MWDDPERRVRHYRVGIAYHFHFDPRQQDDMTCDEFDQFAATVENIAQENEKQRREAEAAGRRRR